MIDNESFYDDYLLKEQPYYCAGMTQEEGKVEEEYLNNNLESFINGGYTPLWKQKNNKNI